MRGNPDSIARLSPSQFRSPEYRAFVLQLFGSDNLEARFRYWQWLYVDNPAAIPGESLPMFVYYDRAGSAAGQMGTVPFELAGPAGPPRAAAWCVDFHVLPQHQRKGLGRRLLAAGEETYGFFATLGQTDQSYNLLVKSGWTQGPSLTTYKCLLSGVGPVLKMTLRKLGFPLGAATASATARASRRDSSDAVERLRTTFRDEDVSSATPSLGAKGRGQVLRSAGYLNSSRISSAIRTDSRATLRRSRSGS